MNQQINDKANAILEKIKELVNKGNISRIIITKNDTTILNVPLNVGILGIALAPWAMILATLVTIGTDCIIKLETTDSKIINIDPENIDKTEETKK